MSTLEIDCENEELEVVIKRTVIRHIHKKDRKKENSSTKETSQIPPEKLVVLDDSQDQDEVTIISSPSSPTGSSVVVDTSLEAEQQVVLQVSENYEKEEIPGR